MRVSSHCVTRTVRSSIRATPTMKALVPARLRFLKPLTDTLEIAGIGGRF